MQKNNNIKAIVLAAGRGSRLEKLTEQTNKCMLELDGKAIIEFSLDNILAAGIEDAIVVVGYKSEEIINKIGIDYKGLKITYVFQNEQKGLVHAIETAKPHIGNSDFMLFLGDEVMKKPRHKKMLQYFVKNKESKNLFGICGMVHVNDLRIIEKTYSVRNIDKTIVRLVEKPRRPFNNLMGTGDCIFDNRILGYIDYTPIHFKRNEKELPDLIQSAIDDGMLIEYFLVCEEYSNINIKNDFDSINL